MKVYLTYFCDDDFTVPVATLSSVQAYQFQKEFLINNIVTDPTNTKNNLEELKSAYKFDTTDFGVPEICYTISYEIERHTSINWAENKEIEFSGSMKEKMLKLIKLYEEITKVCDSITDEEYQKFLEKGEE